ncbi:hypothetical protein [Hymenobacter cheonanensis]|uniref:hypothetical protein n=1 Tax=Hymenobacter sp. CA2-7 TaxID=3063993 RepID=UPI0027123723|nr:hypothetical protein [Hymenobacter sp. CA2-7]MDO7884273.1 hypothetical protein [Hymenobacter sp. CA2-7]
MPIETIKIERLKHLATAVATDGGRPSPQEEAEYTQIRWELMDSQELSGQLPNFVRACSNLMEVRRDIQPLGGYKERRDYIRQELASLLTGAAPRDPFQEVVAATDLSNLATLPADIQKKGKEGADCFVYLFCIENSIREFIIQVMAGRSMAMPRAVEVKIATRKQSEATRKYLPVRGTSDVYYCDFIELADIVAANWNVFSVYFPGRDEHWFKNMMRELYAVRLLIGHNSTVGDVELRQLDVFYRLIMSYLKLDK